MIQISELSLLKTVIEYLRLTVKFIGGKMSQVMEKQRQERMYQDLLGAPSCVYIGVMRVCTKQKKDSMDTLNLCPGCALPPVTLGQGGK